MDKRKIMLLLCLFSLLLAACGGTLEVGVESTAAPDSERAALATESESAAVSLPLAWTTIVSSSREWVGEPPEGCEQVGWNMWECKGVVLPLKDAPTPLAPTPPPTPERTVHATVRALATQAPPTLAGTAAVSGLAEPLLIDGEKGWIFASAQVDGQPRTVKLSTQDGQLLAAYPVTGRLALDRTNTRLFGARRRGAPRGAGGFAQP